MLFRGMWGIFLIGKFIKENIYKIYVFILYRKFSFNEIAPFSPRRKGDDFMAEKKENKPKRKSNGKNSPVIGDNGLMVEPGDNAKYLSLGKELFN